MSNKTLSLPHSFTPSASSSIYFYYWRSCLISYLSSGIKAKNQGFTLLELLIVVIIVGILAAIAVPNLLAQVGKARESEAKKTIGAFNRVQQAYFSENGGFASSFEDLEMSTSTDNYYDYISSGASMMAGGKDNLKNGTRDYAGGVQYALDTRAFNTIICRSKKPPNYSVSGVYNTGVVSTAGFSSGTSKALACTSFADPIK